MNNEMPEITSNVEKMIFQIAEEQDRFIFKTISPYCSRIVQHEISKNEITRALMKEKARKPVPDGWRELCPVCGAQIFRGNYNGREFENNYCAKCGQRLDFAADAGKTETIEPKPMIPQIRTFRARFEEMHKEPPRYIFCNEKTFRELEIEAGVGYIPKPANKCPTAYGMVFVVPKDGEIIIGNGYVEKYNLKGGDE